MGTNYYHSTENRCPTCGHDSGEKLHIGKSSVGWCFSLHVSRPDEAGPRNLKEWQERWKTGTITDEYGQVLTPNEMTAIIVNRSRPEREACPYGYRSWAQFHQANQSMPGPNNLERHALSADHCIEHGEGPWDHIVGDFS